MVPNAVMRFLYWILVNVARLDRRMFYLGGKIMIGNILFVLVTILMYAVVVGLILVVVAATVWAVSKILRRAFSRKDKTAGYIAN